MTNHSTRPDVLVHYTLDEGLEPPQYMTADAAGMDLRAAHDVTIHAHSRAVVGTGLRLVLPRGYEGQVRSRSGLAARDGVAVLNAPGTIDADYRGEVKVILHNTSVLDVTYPRGARIAQLVIAPVVQATMQATDELPPTERGDGGLGSTGQ
jgi:dUTP pyrophosphatase